MSNPHQFLRSRDRNSSEDVLRTIGDLLFVFDLEPFWQPLVQGVILLAAVSLGAIRLLRMRNRLDVFT